MILKNRFLVLLLILSQAASVSVRVCNYSPDVKLSARYSLKVAALP